MFLNESAFEDNSKYTAKERRYHSYPTKYLHRNKLLSGNILDYGSGYGRDVIFLEKCGYNVSQYDPFYFPEKPKSLYDTIICNYVLNVLPIEKQTLVLLEISRLLNPNGTAFFSVRRDVKQSGLRYNPKHRLKTYQCNVKLPFKSVHETEHCEIYAYKRYPDNAQRLDNCSFCSPPSSWKFIAESATICVMENEIGRITIFPKKHVTNYAKLSLKEQFAFHIVLNFLMSRQMIDSNRITIYFSNNHINWSV